VSAGFTTTIQSDQHLWGEDYELNSLRGRVLVDNIKRSAYFNVEVEKPHKVLTGEGGE